MLNRYKLFFFIKLLIIFSIANPLCASFAGSINNKNFGSVTVSEITSIYDADTFRVNIHSWPRIIGERIPIRVNGIDAPEMRGKCQKETELARKAKKVTVAMLRNGKEIELRNLKRGKYFRIVADVYIDGKSLSEVLISQGLAYEYYGGKKKSWCS